MRPPLLFLLPILTVLGGCAVGPDYESPALPAGAELPWIGSDPDAMEEEPPDIDWWKRFEDPLLTQLINEAVANNRNLAAAAQRVAQARALRKESAGGFWPSVGLEGGHSRESSSAALDFGENAGSTRSIYRGGFEASWELDVFGGVRRSEQAAEARTGLAVEDERTLRLAVIAEVARAYFEYRGLQARIAILEQNIDLQADTVDLVEVRFEIGEATEFDLTRAQGQLQATRALRPQFRGDLVFSANRLAVLLGRPPNGIRDLLAEPDESTVIPDQLPVGQRADILRRRPDVRAAERSLAAATAEVGVATADLFPRFFLIGGAGRSARTVDDLRNSSADFFSFSQLFEWPLFEGGSLRAALAATEAGASEAAALYEQSVLEALADAETALARFVRSHQARLLLREAYENRLRSAELALALFDAGEEDFLSVIDAERDRAAAGDSLVLGEIQVRLAAVNLFASLGGGWEAFEPEDAPHGSEKAATGIPGNPGSSNRDSEPQ